MTSTGNSISCLLLFLSTFLLFLPYCIQLLRLFQMVSHKPYIQKRHPLITKALLYASMFTLIVLNPLIFMDFILHPSMIPEDALTQVIGDIVGVPINILMWFMMTERVYLLYFDHRLNEEQLNDKWKIALSNNSQQTQFKFFNSCVHFSACGIFPFFTRCVCTSVSRLSLCVSFQLFLSPHLPCNRS